MRILVIRLKNINSLKGDWEVRLDTPPISNAGLFAITGPTGSGKTTLLDAVTLALYGNTARMKEVSKGTLGLTGGIVTRFSTEAMSEVEFEIKGKKYKSNWSVKLSKEGKLTYPPTMRLSDLDEGKDITNKKTETVKAIEQLIGLNQNQFLQSVLLSQGRFKEFLDADADNRAILLEKITGAHIYRRIGKLVYRKVSELQVQKNNIETNIKILNVLPDEEREKLEQDLKNTLLIISEIDPELKKVNDWLAEWKLLKEWKKSLEENENKKDSFQKKWISFQPHLALIKKHEESVKYISELTLLNAQKLTIETTFSELQNLNLLQSELDQKLSAIEQSIRANIPLFQQDSFFSDSFAYLNTLQNAQVNYQLALQKIQSRTETWKEKLKGDKNFHFGEELGNISRVLVSEALSACKNGKQKLEFKEGENEEVLIQEIQNLQKLQADVLPGLFLRLKDRSQWEERKLSILKNSIIVEKRIEQLKEELKNSTEKKALVQLLEEKLKLEFDLRKAKLELQAYSHLVQPGENCPLCNSIVENKLEYSDLDLQSKKKEWEERVEELKEILNLEIRLEEEVKNNLQRLAEHSSEIKSLDEKLNVVVIDLEESFVKLGMQSQSAEADLIKFADQIKMNLNSLQAKIRCLEEEEFLVDCLKQVQEYEKCYSEFKETESVIKELIHDVSLSETLKLQEQNWKTLRTDLQNKNEQIRKSTELWEASKLKFSFMEQVLLEKINREGIASILELRQSILPQEDFDNLCIQKKSHEDEKVSLDSIEAEGKVQIARMQQKLESTPPEVDLNESRAKLEIERETHFGLRGAILEKFEVDNKNKKAAQELLENLKKIEEELRYYSIMNKDIGDSQGDKFTRIVQRFTLRKLIALSNVRLTTLMDRYVLCVEEQMIVSENPGLSKSAEEKKMDQIMVMDRYMGDIKRGVVTLSGGESFLVSLALALALSDLAAGNIQIDTLFIDEGFGTLDPTTLDMAISTLEKLQQEGGKTIGIISHVESLKDRITCQVILNKEKSGYSTLRVSNE